MQITVHYEPASPREAVVLHAWEPAGHVWDLPGKRLADGTFRFLLQGETADPRQVQFQCRFPQEVGRWEPEEWVRRIPTREATEVWTFDYTARAIAENAYGKPAPEQITFHVITETRFSGRQLFVWQPDGTERQWLPEAARDDGTATSTFVLPVAGWMQRGFHFKLVTRTGDDEPDRSNRVWRPGDGPEVWLKSGEVSLRPAPLARVTAPIRLIFPRNLGAPPALRVADDVEDFQDSLSAASTEELANGVPMLFMGEEAGEDVPFYFAVNGGYAAALTPADTVQLPGIGASVLERR